MEPGLLNKRIPFHVNQVWPREQKRRFYDDHDRKIWDPHAGHVVGPLAKTLYDDYLCLVASNQQQIQWTRMQRNALEHWIVGNSLVGADSSKHEVVNAMKST